MSHKKPAKCVKELHCPEQQHANTNRLFIKLCWLMDKHAVSTDRIVNVDEIFFEDCANGNGTEASRARSELRTPVANVTIEFSAEDHCELCEFVSNTQCAEAKPCAGTECACEHPHQD